MTDLKEEVTSGILHAVFGAIFTVLVGFSTGEWLAGTVGAGMFYLGWEVTQRRFQIAEGRSQKTLKPWEGFDMVNWSRDRWIDLGFGIFGPVVILIVARLHNL
jgi:hypothetical protein